jgi:hypothetical protein
MLAASQTALASDDLGLLDLLTCNAQANPARAAKASDDLEARGKKSDDGVYLAGSIRSGDVCIEHATVSGGFGVLMVSASVCDGQTKPLEAYLARTNSQLRPKAPPAGPGAIKAFEAPQYSLLLFYGAPDMKVEPDPSSSTISYICGRQAGGPQ